MSAIHFNHISFSYSSAVPIIEDATFDLGPGWTGLVGANGVGKSTLLHLIAGSLQANTGSIAIEPVGLTPVICEQRVDDRTDDIEELSWDWERDAVRMRAALVSVLRKRWLGGDLAVRRFRAAIDDLADLPRARHPGLSFMVRAYGLRANVSPYDACYVGLADVLRCPLVTADLRLASAPGPRCEVHVIRA